jgi:hypothetical protein
MSEYRKVFDPIKEGNPAPIVNPAGNFVACLGCGRTVVSLDALCTDCWMTRHDARIVEPPAKERIGER